MIASVPAQEPARGLDAVRVPAADIGAFVERDRRANTERIIELGRWLMLIFAAVSANLPAPATRSIGTVNGILGVWGAFNLAVTASLVTGHLPGRRMQYLMTGVDVSVATALVALTGGFGSNFGVVFYAVVVASTLRFGMLGSLGWVVVVSCADVLAGLTVDGTLSRTAVTAALTQVFLFLVIAMISSLVTRELILARGRQMEHTYRLEHAAFFELREIDRLKSEFIMLASHELRTPLAKIKAWLALMRDAGDRLPAASHAEALDVLRSESEHLARLTDNLLCIAQLESGEIRIKTGPVSTAKVLEQVLSRFVEADNRGRCHAEVDADAGIVVADREKLALGVACLVDNALKFSPDSEPVLIGARREGSTVRIEVRDNGRRIPNDQRERIFHSFYQMEAPLQRQRGGAGVGLYLARQLVERMGGRIFIEHERSRGNTFCIVLPAEG